MTYHSILREEEYLYLSQLSLDGDILDVGGSKSSGYQELIKGNNNFVTINIDEGCKPDFIVDVEKSFPFEDNSFNHSISLNLLEHIFEFENTISEQVRCVKFGGKIVIAIPFMHHIHASPYDYHRYTESSYKRLARKYSCEIESIVPLGFGFFSLTFKTIGGTIPTKTLQILTKSVCVNLDKILNKLSKKYRILSSRIPLGYFVVLKKANPTSQASEE